MAVTTATSADATAIRPFTIETPEADLEFQPPASKEQSVWAEALEISLRDLAERTTRVENSLHDTQRVVDDKADDSSVNAYETRVRDLERELGQALTRVTDLENEVRDLGTDTG